MASSSSSSISFLSRAVSRQLLPSHSPAVFPLSRFCTAAATTSSSLESDSGPASDPDPESSPDQDKQKQQKQRLNFERLLEDGIDPGVFKAFLVGKVGQYPVQKRLRSGRVVTLFSLGTGGIRNNRRPLDDEDPKEYANRCSVQWHRVSVYPESLGMLAKKHVKPGSLIYLEGNLETKIFADPISGLVKRIREIAIRRDAKDQRLKNCGDKRPVFITARDKVLIPKDSHLRCLEEFHSRMRFWRLYENLFTVTGRLVFLGKGDDDQADSDARGVGYF